MRFLWRFSGLFMLLMKFVREMVYTIIIVHMRIHLIKFNL